jgi:hypothetical protein
MVRINTEKFVYVLGSGLLHNASSFSRLRMLGEPQNDERRAIKTSTDKGNRRRIDGYEKRWAQSLLNIVFLLPTEYISNSSCVVLS